ncbi:type II toxin-antitoxin system HicA family toxin [Bacillus cereus]|uniref:type II toxin-antitoxin system HicA family toxin n=1 Tax=Bacillus cereus TaxID=1396 RepID=UPI001E30DEE9|nr:type II toxin-antitoxin system HicA family toxin [Bacillus cereus]MCD2338363.1 type II toxin-antitoxin system HicA family toxin [Bacillus cereus]MCU4734296.1 type II toxin-antitoxin system HicA family toxin [Bacillus cereus]
MLTFKELKRFCEKDGWECYKDTDHYFYRKIMPDGTIKRTKFSKGTVEIKHHLWRKILKQQLQVSLEYFNGYI